MNLANLCVFEGRVVRDPQYSNYQINGQNGPQTIEKAIFTIAVDRSLSSAQRQKVKNGDKTIKTADFIPCSLSGAKVAVLRQYFFKGKAIRVAGRYTEYQTKDQQTGETKYGHIFELDDIGFCVQDPKGQDAGNQGGYQQNSYAQNNGYQQNNYQQPQQYQQQAPQNNGFSMFDENNSPF